MNNVLQNKVYVAFKYNGPHNLLVLNADAMKVTNGGNPRINAC
jgi:hypothetical protein